jgi:signal transduction histidine kinase
MAHEMLSILIVDDDKGDRAFCQRELKSALGDGLRIQEADNGESGLLAIENDCPDCVLLDHSLPGIDGVEVLRRLRVEHPYLPVVMIDGKGNDVVAVQSMKEGAQDYIAKSTITARTLERAVRMAIERCELQKRDHDQRASLELFTRALAHDLKEPVRTIRSFLDRITDWRDLTAPSQKSFQHIYKSAHRMSALIDAVHLYTRLDAAEQMERTSCDLNGVLGQVRDNLAELIERRGTIITSGILPQVQVDEIQMLQLFQNLLSNAIRYCETAVTVHVSAQEYDQQWLLTVRDDGPGVAPENLQKIFEPFKRLSHSKEEGPGLGLGLAINRKIVESHGGKIWCESQRDDGAAFLFTLPKATTISGAASDAAVRVASPCIQPGAPRPLGSILMVDDNEDDIELNSIFLIEQPKIRCNLLTARDGQEALATLRSSIEKGNPIELLLLDINMPVMSGFELLKQMQKERMLADTLVVICTTSDDDMDKRTAALLGAVGYLTKPPKFLVLKDIINRCGRLRLHEQAGDHALLRAA